MFCKKHKNCAKLARKLENFTRLFFTSLNSSFGEKCFKKNTNSKKQLEKSMVKMIAGRQRLRNNTVAKENHETCGSVLHQKPENAQCKIRQCGKDQISDTSDT